RWKLDSQCVEHSTPRAQEYVRCKTAEKRAEGAREAQRETAANRRDDDERAVEHRVASIGRRTSSFSRREKVPDGMRARQIRIAFMTPLTRPSATLSRRERDDASGRETPASRHSLISVPDEKPENGIR